MLTRRQISHSNENATLMRDDDLIDFDALTRIRLELPAQDFPAEEQQLHIEEIEHVQEHRSRRRAARSVVTDDITTLHTTDMTQWNDNYSENMAQEVKHKLLNKLPAIARRNAAFWVFGQGVGSVGIGVGQQREAHPLQCYSGEELYDAVCGAGNGKLKRVRDDEQYNRADATTERERARGEEEEPEDVEIGRHAPSSIYDDRSSQMPWNITASVQSSRHGRMGSVNEVSARGVPESDTVYGRRPRGRLTSASPLAGRGYLDGREHLSSLSIPGNADNELGELDITQYLEGELATGLEDINALSSRRASIIEQIGKTLDRESLNFYEFIMKQIDDSDRSDAIAFSSLLPPAATTRTVATQGLMNVLTLATKGLLDVSQQAYEDAGVEAWGVRYQYGEIHLKLCGL